MTHSTRRRFLQKSTLVTLATAAATGGVAFGSSPAETTLRSLDRELAAVLRSYGRANKLREGEFAKEKAGSRARRLPLARLGVQVRDQESFRKSFEKLTHLSDEVLVNGNTVKLSRGGRCFVIENRLS